jgi:hypothetical protein
MNKGPNVSPAVAVIVIVVVLVAAFGVWKLMNKRPSDLIKPEGSKSMMGPKGMQEKGGGEGKAAPPTVPSDATQPAPPDAAPGGDAAAPDAAASSGDAPPTDAAAPTGDAAPPSDGEAGGDAKTEAP